MSTKSLNWEIINQTSPNGIESRKRVLWIKKEKERKRD